MPGLSLKLTGLGGCYITGNFSGNAVFENNTVSASNGSGFFIARYNSTGHVPWVNTSSPSSSDNYSEAYGNSITTDANGMVYVTGNVLGEVDIQGTYLSGDGSNSIFIAKYGANGADQWVKQVDGNEIYSVGIDTDASGTLYLAGDFSGTASLGNFSLASSGNRDVYLAKMDNAGNILWAKKAGGTEEDYLYGIAVSKEGDSYLTGNFVGTASFEATTLTSNSPTHQDIFLASYTTLGQLRGVQQVKSSNNKQSKGIAVNPVGEVYLTGKTDYTATFGTISLPSTRGNNIFLAKACPYAIPPSTITLAVLPVSSVCASNSLPVRFTTSGPLAANETFTAQLSNLNDSTFAATPVVLGTTATDSLVTVTIPANTVKGTYKIRIVSSSGVVSNLRSLLIVNCTQCTNEVQWAITSSSPNGLYNSKMAVDASGNSYVTVNFTGTVTFEDTTLTSNSTNNTFAVKYDAFGKVVWIGDFITSNNGYSDGSGIAIDASGNSYLIGYFGGTIILGDTSLTSPSGNPNTFIVKYDVFGKVVWARQIIAENNSYNLGSGITVDALGNSYVTADFKGTAVFGDITLTSHEDNTFIVKYDAFGKAVWVRAPIVANSNDSYSSISDITVDALGNSYVTGDFTGTVAFGNNILTSNGSNNVFVVKYDGLGKVAWLAQAVTTNNDYVHSYSNSSNIAVDASGNSYIMGDFRGIVTFGDTTLTSINIDNVFIIKYDAFGRVVWVRQPVAVNDNFISGSNSDITVDALGNSYVTGHFRGTVAFGDITLINNVDNDNTFIVKYDTSGNVVWAIQTVAANNSYTYGNSIGVDAFGNSYVMGVLSGTVAFGNIILTSSGDYDNTFLAKFCSVPVFAPSIVLTPLPNISICPGSSTPLPFTLAGDFAGETFTAQLSQNGGSWINIGSGDQSPLTTTIPLNTSNGTYQVRVMSSPNHVVSNTVNLTVQNTLDGISFTASSIASCVGSPVIFTAVDNPAYTYTWTIEGAGTRTGNPVTVNFNTPGTKSIQLAATYNGCATTITQTYTVSPLATASLAAQKNVSCGTASDGALQLTFNGATSYQLYRNSVPMGETVAANGNNPVILNGLPTGNYSVSVTNQYGCATTSNTITIGDGSPQAQICTAVLPCQDSGEGSIYFNLHYPAPPPSFANQYQYRILRNGVEVIPLKLATPNNPNPVDGLYGDHTAVYNYLETIPNAQAGDVYTLEVSALVERTAGCNCYDAYCTKPFSFSFAKTEPTLTVSAAQLVDGKATYYMCDPNGKATVNATFSKILGNCSAPMQGYRLTLSKNGGTPVVLADTSISVTSVQLQRSLLLSTGEYTLDGEIGTGNYHCHKTVSFRIISLSNLSAKVNTTPAGCGDGSARALVSGGVGTLTYRWFRQRTAGSAFDTLTYGGRPYSSAHVTGLTAGNYRLDVQLAGSSLGCTQQVPFTIDSLATVEQLTVAAAQCGATATGLIPSGTNARYRVDWYRYAPNPTPRHDSLVFTEFVVATDSLRSTLAELVADTAQYYVIVTNERGCPVTSPSALLRKVHVARSYQLCLQWQTPKLPPVAEPPSTTVNSLTTIAASNFRNAMDDKVLGCVIKQQKLVAANIGANCLSPGAVHDSLTVSYHQQYHHYTLYYYDRSGSLVRTVPPQGVRPLAPNQLSRDFTPAHEYVTNYRYNSLGQLVRQFTPDGDTTHFVYNQQGQLRFSRNARQQLDSTYSYTKYDELGRISEVGQATVKSGQTMPAFTASVSDGTAELAADLALDVAGRYPTIASASLGEQTVTVYTQPRTGVSYFGQPQRYLQNRVSYSYTHNKNDTTQGVYTYYSYDPHGNVEWLIQELPGLPRAYVAYEYDLISGKVLKVKYNEFLADRFFHRYAYDEDNRLTLVETSRDGHLWDQDAAYDYYKHGPLQRQALGEDHVQGLDYTYTIQGWLKGINAPSVNAASDTLRDLGGDGRYNSRFSRDVFGMALNYYKGDYEHVGSVFESATNRVNQFNLSPDVDLYNGNIATWVSQTGTLPTEGNQYRYDRLNRLKASQRSVLNAANGQWKAGTALATNYRYDANGNLLTLNRLDEKGQPLDSLAYAYQIVNGRKTNRLQQVTDRATATAYADDLEGTHQYEYDPIGNLIKDFGDSVQVHWNVYGKVSQVEPLNGSKKPHLHYRYDAAGNRVMKEVNTGMADGSQPEKVKTTYYVRDAQGNVLSLYERSAAKLTDTTQYQLSYRQKEVPLYGSDRLGEYQPDSVVFSRVYSKGEMKDASPTTNPNELRTENRNQVTATNMEQSLLDSLGQTQTILSAMLVPIDGTSPPWQTGNNQLLDFVGQMNGNLAVGETLAGQAEVYAATAARYWGASNVTLVVNTAGELLTNSDSIHSDAQAKNLLVRKPGIGGQYYLFTRDTTGQLLSHVVSKDSVFTKNAMLGDTSAGYIYGQHLAAIEDRTTQQIYLYASRWRQGQVELMLFNLDSTGLKATTPLLTEASVDSLGRGELQISHDGKKLLWYQLGGQLGFFPHRQMQPKEYSLSEDDHSVGSGKSLPLPSGGQETTIASLDMKRNGTIVYTQRGFSRAQTWQTDGRTTSLYTTTSGDVRRSLQDSLYVLIGGLSEQVHTILPFDTTAPFAGYVYRLVGKKSYELKDHLGNVRVVVSDEKKTNLQLDGSSLNLELVALVKSYYNYYPFGMMQPGGVSDSTKYRYGFNGKEKDIEFQNNYDYGFRIYHPGLAKFLSVDPLSSKYPWYTPYQFAGNKPIWAIDLDGLEELIYTYDFATDKITKTKIELPTAGSMGHGILIQSNHGGTTAYYYGDEISDPAITSFKKAYEGVVLDKDGNHVVYNDSNELPTIGYGHLIKKDESYKAGSTITEEEAQTLFKNDSEEIFSLADKNLKAFTLKDIQKNALYDASFNMGAGKMTQYKEDASKFAGESFFLQFMSGGEGIKKRRYAENLLYSEGLYIHLDYLKSTKQQTVAEGIIKKATTPPQEATNATTLPAEIKKD